MRRVYSRNSVLPTGANLPMFAFGTRTFRNLPNGAMFALGTGSGRVQLQTRAAIDAQPPSATEGHAHVHPHPHAHPHPDTHG